MLRLPGESDELAPLVMPAKPPPAFIDADEDDDTEDELQEPVRSDLPFYGVLTAGGLALLGGFWFWMKPDPQEQVVAPTAVQISDSEPDGDEAESTEVRSENDFVRIEKVVKAFLEAPSEEEALKWVRSPSSTAEKMRGFLNGDAYKAPGFNGIAGNESGTSIRDKRVQVYTVRVANYDRREIAVVDVAGEFKVDWESWVGFSEMSWEDFKRDKPTDPKVFRVVLGEVEYYNFGFKNDREWTSYKLESPNGHEVIYGYVPYAGDIDQNVKPVEKGEKVKLTLALRFAEGAESNNQVIIDKVIGEGWVDLEETN